ncbi:MAG: radical domain protein [Clostridia bacterium]|nr:radical domain protein [Clostridia bacterium]
MNYEEALLQTEYELRNSTASIILWGAGILGQMALKVLRHLGREPICYCDINKELHGTDMHGFPVLSVEEAISKYPTAIFILCVGVMGNSYGREEEAAKQARILNHTGTIVSADVIHYIYNVKVLKRGISSANYAQTIYNLRHSDNVLQRLSIVITDRCTLNCRDCGMLIPYKKPGKDADVEMILSAVEKMFSMVEGIRWVQIFGGEPFLHPRLLELTRKVVEIDKALSVVLITNATLPPIQEQYNELASYISYFTYSDYGPSLSKYCNEVDNACKSSGMVYSKSNYNQDGLSWVTYGPVSNKNYTDDEKKVVFNNCMQAECNYRISPDGIFYFCERQLHPAIRPIGNTENEIIHLEDPEMDGAVLQAKWEYIRRLPYLKACDYCGGGGYVPAAVQAKGKLDYEDMEK